MLTIFPIGPQNSLSKNLKNIKKLNSLKAKRKAVTQFIVGALLIVSPQVLDVLRVMQALSVERLQVVSSPSIAVNNPVGSFPIGAQLALCSIFSSHCHIPQEKVSNTDVSRPNLSIVVSSHKVLVASHPLLNYRPTSSSRFKCRHIPSSFLPSS